MSDPGQGGQGGIGQGDTVGRGEKLVCAHTRVTPVSPGAVSNTSSLFTYDSWLLVYQFENGPKHNPNFKPLFPDETMLSPSQTEDVARLCEGDHFCILDVMSTGSSSVGNATRIAHQLHQHRLKSLQPGRGWEGTQGVDLSDRPAHPPIPVQWPAVQACPLCSAHIPVVSCGWLPAPANGNKEGLRYLEGSIVRFNCNNGYSLVGPESSTCQADGRWSTPTPECQPGEPPLPSCLCTPVPSWLLSTLSSLSGRSYTVLLSIIFGGLAIVALISIVYMMLHRRRKSNM